MFSVWSDVLHFGMKTLNKKQQLTFNIAHHPKWAQEKVLRALLSENTEDSLGRLGRQSSLTFKSRVCTVQEHAAVVTWTAMQ